MIFRQTANIPESSDINNLIFEGMLPNPGSNKIPLELKGNTSFIKNGYLSTVVFYSEAGENLDYFTFTITGTFNGYPISETVIGPETDAITYGNNLYDEITSIIISTLPDSYSPENRVNIYTGTNVAVILNDHNSDSSLTHPNYNYNIAYGSLTATLPWKAKSFAVYGVIGTIPSLLQVSSLMYDDRLNNYFPLLGSADITAPVLNQGNTMSLTYPYKSIVFFLGLYESDQNVENPTNEQPVCIEITQS